MLNRHSGVAFAATVLASLSTAQIYSWAPITQSVVRPVPRVDTALGLHPASGRLVLFGGIDDTNRLGDTWTWAGTAWRLALPSNAPSPRSGALLTAGPDGKAWLLGGEDDTGPRIDFWSWNGTNWTQELTPPVDVTASPRALMMAYDEQRDLLVATFQKGPSFQIREWDGNRWTQPLPQMPAPGTGVGFYSPLYEMVTYLESEQGSLLRTWDGTAVGSGQGIPSRTGARLVHEQDRLLIFARNGSTLEGWAQDLPADIQSTWSSIGSWSTLGFTGASLAYHPDSDSIVLVGGRDGSNGPFNPDTYVMDSLRSNLASVTEFGQGCIAAATVPRIAPAPGRKPYVDEQFRIDLTGLNPAPTTIPFICYGSSNAVWGPWQLPFHLQPIGGRGCFSYIEVLEAFQLFNNGGSANWLVPIPNDPIVIGSTFYSQAVIFDATANNALGITTSNALECVIGER